MPEWNGQLKQCTGFLRHVRKFCVGDIRQSQEWRCGSRAKSGEISFSDHSPGVGRGMHAAGVNAGARSREFYRQGNLPVLSWPPAEGTSAPVG